MLSKECWRGSDILDRKVHPVILLKCFGWDLYRLNDQGSPVLCFIHLQDGQWHVCFTIEICLGFDFCDLWLSCVSKCCMNVKRKEGWVWEGIIHFMNSV